MLETPQKTSFWVPLNYSLTTLVCPGKNHEDELYLERFIWIIRNWTQVLLYDYSSISVSVVPIYFYSESGTWSLLVYQAHHKLRNIKWVITLRHSLFCIFVLFCLHVFHSEKVDENVGVVICDESKSRFSVLSHDETGRTHKKVER